MNPEQITAFVLARNEAPRIERALRSLPRRVRALVVDAESTDGTADVARSCGAEVIVRPWEGFVATRRFALSHIETRWALMLDADEVLDERLRDSIIAADGSVDGYYVWRDTYVGSKRMRIWSREPLIRLFRRDAATIETRASVAGAELHEHVTVRGRVDALSGTLMHYSYANVSAYWKKFARYTTIEASAAHPSLSRAIVSAAMIGPRFLRLLAKGAAADGLSGWTVAYGSALYPAVVALKALHR